MPYLRQTERDASLAAELGLQFGKCQIRLGMDPSQHLRMQLCTDARLATRLVRHPFGFPRLLALRGNLLCPPNTHQKTARQLFQRLLALIVGKKKLTA
jgi:hypothetical protein